jgi:hypothetical protein
VLVIFNHGRVTLGLGLCRTGEGLQGHHAISVNAVLDVDASLGCLTTHTLPVVELNRITVHGDLHAHDPFLKCTTYIACRQSLKIGGGLALCSGQMEPLLTSFQPK